MLCHGAKGQSPQPSFLHEGQVRPGSASVSGEGVTVERGYDVSMPHMTLGFACLLIQRAAQG